MPRLGLTGLLFLTLLSAEVQFFGFASRPGIRVGAITRQLQQNVLIRRTVATCEELQEALRDLGVVQIIISGKIVCTGDNWPEPIIVRRNLDITGDFSEFGEGFPTRTRDLIEKSVNWTDLNKVLVVERTAVASFHDLVMLQDKMGLDLDFAFLHTRQTATGLFSGIVMIVASCSQSVKSHVAVLEELPRPEFRHGEQTARTIGSSSLLLEDVAFLLPSEFGLWQICYSVFMCGITNLDSPAILEHFQRYQSSGVGVSCSSGGNGEDSPVMSDLLDPLIDVRESSGDGAGNPSVVGTIVLVVAVTGLVVFMTAGMTYYLIFRSRKHISAQNTETPAAGQHVHRDGRSVSEVRRPSFHNPFAESINVPLQDVEVGTLLGRGGFGKVYKGTWKGTVVAIKVIEHGERLMENDLKLPFEAYLSKHINHPNVVQTFLIHTRQQDSPHGVTVDTMELNESLTQPITDKGSLMSTHDIFSNMAKGSVGNEGGELFETWLVLEYCDRGSLAKAVRKGLMSNQRTMKPIMDHVLLSALDVANAMNYLHSLGITHGDLKADNVLLKSASTDRRKFFCKVSDFGLSRFMGGLSYIQTFTYGTITHMPPELLKDGVLTPSVDIYSFGMLLWELLSNLQPYAEKNHGEIILAVVNEGRRPHIGPRFPDCYADLIRDCWKQNRHDRPKFPDIVRRLKQMLINFETYGTLCGIALTDSACSYRKDERAKLFADDSPKRHKLDSEPPDVMPLPEVPTAFYYDNTNSQEEDKDGEGFHNGFMQSNCSSRIADDPASNDSGYISDGFRSATSHVTRSSDH